MGFMETALAGGKICHHRGCNGTVKEINSEWRRNFFLSYLDFFMVTFLHFC